MNFNIYTRFSQKFAILTRFIVFERNHSLKLLAKERNSGHWRNGADLWPTYLNHDETETKSDTDSDDWCRLFASLCHWPGYL